MQYLRIERKPKLVAMANGNISLKAVVDKTTNRVVFAESDEKFVDILFSFLTMPVGTTVRLTRSRPPTTSIGCMNNLYNSVEILDKRYLRTEACKTMLLYPRNGASAQCKNLKLKIDDSPPLRYFLCGMCNSISNYMLLSYYETAVCGCGGLMNCQRDLKEKETTRVVFDDQDGGVFVKGPILLTISDELQVMPSSTLARLSLFSKLGINDTSTIEERTFSMGVREALELLKCLLVSKTPLTEALLEQCIPLVSLNNVEGFERVSFRKVKMEEAAESNEGGEIYVKLMVSKSKNKVCYAEANEKFVDLLFSFLTVPLGFIVKEMGEGSSKACLSHLYDSIQDLDARQCLVSEENTAMLVNPKLAPGFSYEAQPLNIEEYMHQPFYLTSDWIPQLTSDETIASSVLTVMDPKSHYNDNSSGRGFLKGPTMFTITDDLIITPLSSITGLSAARELKVPFSDMEEHIVYVGKEEASRLLVASFVSESALTNTFLLKESKQGS
ncbi:uncharacterized protein LOC111302133 [Durio zibethinus]|uniref:Uncharacterized protein LOC111302133 n=1 Tax=Durio zibethinus TaxID=66656 RepID=A0A6P5ZNA1_DURZI|nr:uncharacterized protein LOC111302133 [Durio zibethinus]XP_022753807.1 uncharacterized protein LOC111302133 [Durio zibethinus]XP_022753808.1 uncharacterized protein LOC111302133 [Durio zibethinus]XP_022753809.1 uncharacterized protein LOC111302133 [Durio zibethinus]